MLGDSEFSSDSLYLCSSDRVFHGPMLISKINQSQYEKIKKIKKMQIDSLIFPIKNGAMVSKIGALIDRRLVDLGITNTDVALKVGVTPQYLSVLKSGKRGAKAPRPNTVRKISEAIEVPIADVWNALLDQDSPAAEKKPITAWPHKDEAATKAASMNIIDYAYWIFDRAIERYPHTQIFLSHPRETMVGHEKPIQRRLDGITNDAECYWECVDWIRMILDIDMKNAMSGRPE